MKKVQSRSSKNNLQNKVNDWLNLIIKDHNIGIIFLDQVYAHFKVDTLQVWDTFFEKSYQQLCEHTNQELEDFNDALQSLKGIGSPILISDLIRRITINEQKLNWLHDRNSCFQER